MALYQYQAKDETGKKRSGLIEAQNEREAKALLREQGAMVTSISVKTEISAKQNLKGDSLLAFTMQLSQLIGSGVPLYESLLTLEEQYRGEPFHRIILSLCEQIKAGNTLSKAMSYYPDSFSKLYRAMVAAGESVGSLDVVFARISELLTRQMKLKQQITTAMIYPAVLASFSLLIIVMLLTFVVPSIESIFADRELNGFTAFVLGTSHFLRNYWWAYLPLVGGAIALLIMKLRSTKGQLWLEKKSLNVPFVRTLIIQTCLARFCRTMGTLQQGGVTLVDSLRVARDVMRNVVLEDEIKRAEAKIIEGSSLSIELQRSPFIPPLVARMLAVGEDSGDSVALFHRLADMYETDVEKSIARIMALAQPAILLFMGALIGLILMAVLLPLTDVSSLSM